MATYTAKDIRKMVTDLVGDAKTLRAKAHQIMVVGLQHYTETGNLSPLADLINRTHRTGLNRRAMIQWINRYARATHVIVDGKVTFRKKDGADHKTCDVDKAKSSPFYDDESLDGQTSDDLKSYNWFGRLRSAVKQAREIQSKIAENGGDFKKAGYDPEKTVLPLNDKGEIDEDLVGRIESFVESYGNLSKPQTKADRKATLFKGAHAQHQKPATVTDTESKTEAA